MKRGSLRYVLRCLPVCTVLAVIGYFYASVLYQVMNANAETPQAGSEALMWRVPVGMAVMGMVMVALLEAFAWWVRRQKKRLLEVRLDSTATLPPPIAAPYLEAQETLAHHHPAIPVAYTDAQETMKN